MADSDGSEVKVFQVDHAEFGHVTLGSSGTPQTLNFIVSATATLTGVAIYTAGTQNLDFTIAANSGTPPCSLATRRAVAQRSPLGARLFGRGLGVFRSRQRFYLLAVHDVRG